MKIKTAVRYHLKPGRMGITKKMRGKCWWGCGGGTLMHCCCKCKLELSQWKTVWRVLRELKIELPCCFCCSVAKSCLSLWPHELQHARLSCPSPSPRVCSNSCSFNLWCHSTILPSAIPFPSCLQSFPASGSFLSLLFTLGGQSIVVSASASVLPMNIQYRFPLGLTGWISL